MLASVMAPSEDGRKWPHPFAFHIRSDRMKIGSPLKLKGIFLDLFPIEGHVAIIDFEHHGRHASAI